MPIDNLAFTEDEWNQLSVFVGEASQAQQAVDRAILAFEGLVGRIARQRGLNLLDYDVDVQAKSFVEKVKDAAFAPIPTPSGGDGPKADNVRAIAARRKQKDEN